MLATLTYFGAHWTIAIAAVCAVLAFGALAWFLKNWKCAVVAIGIAVAGFLYQGAVTDGIKIQMAKEAQAKIELLTSRIRTLNKATEEDAARGKADADRIEELEKLANDTPKNDGACLDADAVNRLRNIK